MISEAQLRRLARDLDVRFGYAEKNYVNSWITLFGTGTAASARRGNPASLSPRPEPNCFHNVQLIA